MASKSGDRRGTLSTRRGLGWNNQKAARAGYESRVVLAQVSNIHQILYYVLFLPFLRIINLFSTMIEAYYNFVYFERFLVKRKINF